MMCEIGIPWSYDEAEEFYTDFITKAKQLKDVWEFSHGSHNAMPDGMDIRKVCSMMKVIL